MKRPGRELEQLLAPFLPHDHSRQTLADSYIEREIGRSGDRPWRVLDLGCGSGSSVDFFRARDPSVRWVGLEVAHPHEPPTRADVVVETFDGVAIPFDDGVFDFVYCKQVLEHVQYPALLLKQVRRVLCPGGYLAGSTSQLEPFHSRSMWNYTPLGFLRLLEEAGLSPIELRPGIDGLVLVIRRLLPRGAPFDRWYARWWAGQSPLNQVIDAYGRARRLDTSAINATKLLFSGQFAFLAQRIE